jgi:hypothetical protein
MMVVAWLVFPVVLGALALGCGLLLERISRMRLDGVLLLPAGVAMIVVIAQIATVAAYETVHANEIEDGPSGPRQTLEAGIDYVKTSIRTWERIAREATTPERGTPRAAVSRRS